MYQKKKREEAERERKRERERETPIDEEGGKEPTVKIISAVAPS